MRGTHKVVDAKSVHAWSYVGLAGLILVTLFFLVTRSYALLVHSADEGIYFYGAQRMTEGILPYRDFFHAHPPFHLLPTALIIWLAGFSLLAVKLPTFLWAAWQGPAAYLIIRQLLPEVRPAARQVAGVLTALLLLFSETMLKASAYDTGIAQACGLVALGAVLAVHHHPIAAGLVTACAPLTLLQSAPAAAFVLVAAFALGRREGVRALLSAVLLFVVVHLVYLASAGNAFFQQTYVFHLEKVPHEGEGARQLGFVLFDNWTLFVVGLGGAVILLLNKGSPQSSLDPSTRGRLVRAALLCLGSASLTLAAMATRPRVFPYYFLPAFFPTALLAGLGIAQVLNELQSWRQAHAVRPDLRLWVPVGLTIALLTFLAAPVSGVVSPRRAEQTRTYTQRYTWVDGPYIGVLNDLVRTLFWQGGQRHAGDNPNALTQFLWQRSRWLDAHPAMVETLRAIARERRGTTLFGDSTVAPLVALEAGVQITGDVVDTNTQRILAGHLPVPEVLALLDAHHEALVLGCGAGVTTLPDFVRYLSSHYVELRDFPSKNGRSCKLYRRH